VEQAMRLPLDARMQGLHAIPLRSRMAAHHGRRRCGAVVGV